MPGPPLVPDVTDVAAELSPDVVTVARVSWSTDTETTGYVSFGETDAYGLTTPISDLGTDHQQLLLGMPADTVVHYQVHVSDGTLQGASDDHTVTTGSLPSGMPTMTVTGDPPTQWAYQVIPTQGTTYVVLIVDNQGRTVWYDQLPAKGNLMRALITHDRQHMVYCLAGPQDALEDGQIEWVSLWGDERITVDFPNIDHDMAELPDGTIASIVSTAAPDGSPYAGATADRIVELAPDGTQTDVWNAWEQLDFAGLGLEGAHSLTHGNALDYVPSEDAYYLSTKELGTIFKIDRSTGQTLWGLNGMLNDFSFPKGTELIQLQHQFELVDGGILIFDNGPQSRGYSRVVELSLDTTAMAADQVWEYIRDPSIYVFAKGDVHRFDDGTTQVVWSSSGEIQDVNPDGSVYWQLDAELGQAITFVQVVDDLYAR
ncbi:MAG: hypothetical protein GXP62_10235 [Oligoflexia bacterium]|nr:hypothetical protein [Oligoflexia bacterium]